VAEAHRGGDAPLEAFGFVNPWAQSVDHHVDVVRLVAVELEAAVNIGPLAVDPSLEIALLR